MITVGRMIGLFTVSITSILLMTNMVKENVLSR